MTKTLKVILVIFVIFAIALMGLYFFVMTKGKALLTTQLEKLLKHKVQIESVQLKFPFILQIHEVTIENIGRIKDLEIKPDIFGLLRGKPILNEIKVSSPQFYFEIKKEKKPESNSLSSGINPALSAETENISQVNLKKKSQNFFLKELKIKNARLHVLDRQVREEGLVIVIDRLNLDIQNLSFPPNSANTDFNLNAKIPWQDKSYEGRIKFRGWINFAKKDIEAELKINDIDGVYLLPYYGKNLSLDKFNIQKGKLNFSSDIRGSNNDVTAKCHLELTELAFKQPEQEAQEISNIEKAQKIVTTVLEVFRAVSGKIVLDFVVKTQFDKPRFNVESLRMALEDKMSKNQKSFLAELKPLFRLQKEFILETIRIPKSALLTTANIGKELKKGIIDNVIEDYKNHSKASLEKNKQDIELQNTK